VKFLSNLIRIGQFTAENAGKRKDRPEGDIKLLMLTANLSFYSSIFSHEHFLLPESINSGSLKQNLNIKEAF